VFLRVARARWPPESTILADAAVLAHPMSCRVRHRYGLISPHPLERLVGSRPPARTATGGYSLRGIGFAPTRERTFCLSARNPMSDSVAHDILLRSSCKRLETQISNASWGSTASDDFLPAGELQP